jgi:hypothetical protein
MFKLNRNEIKKVLNEYKESKNRLQELNNNIIEDEEIQSLYEMDQIREARKMIRNKYPEYAMVKSLVADNGIKLIETMIEGIKEYEGIKPSRIYNNVTMFDKMIRLAEEV